MTIVREEENGNNGGERDRQCAGVTNVAVAPCGLKMTRMRACNAVRCATAPQRQIQAVKVARGLDPGGFAQVFIGCA